MPEIKKILFPFEMEGTSKKVAPWVDLIGKTFNAEVHVLHVVPEMKHFHVAYSIPAGLMDDEEALKNRAARKMKEFCDQYLNYKSSLKQSVSLGDPVEEILNYIKSEDISMIILASHTQTGLERKIFGSIAEQVSRLSPVPVLGV